MLTRLNADVWYALGAVRVLGTRLTSTMTILRLPDGALLVHSPIAHDAALDAEVRALGRVAHLYAPNTFHHTWMGEWSAAFPDALVHAPRELAAKRPGLRIDRAHDEPGGSALEGVHEITIRGFRMRETVLVHRASKTLVVADLVHNIGRPNHVWTRLYSQAMGFYDRVALSRVLRWTSFDDAHAARQSVERIFEHELDNVVVGHGAPIVTDARALLRDATAWLPPLIEAER